MRPALPATTEPVAALEPPGLLPVQGLVVSMTALPPGVLLGVLTGASSRSTASSAPSTASGIKLQISHWLMPASIFTAEESRCACAAAEGNEIRSSCLGAGAKCKTSSSFSGPNSQEPCKALPAQLPCSIVSLVTGSASAERILLRGDLGDGTRMRRGDTHCTHSSDGLVGELVWAQPLRQAAPLPSARSGKLSTECAWVARLARNPAEAVEHTAAVASTESDPIRPRCGPTVITCVTFRAASGALARYRSVFARPGSAGAEFPRVGLEGENGDVWRAVAP
mmetsp:Transcript_98767/g.274875  ORF Transcript_98767/g.274875 Transcript_98767/m.274875 type:complete len:281 (+) Transcript_98767:68-910(+)